MRPKIYSTNLESTIIKHILATKKSVTITMAWFTNKDILQALVDLKRKKDKVSVRLLVDNNKINDAYFSVHKNTLVQAGIIILSYLHKNLQHQKFMVIDHYIVLDGSYNYTKRANLNSEHIVGLKCKFTAYHFEKLFSKYTETDYIDPNIQLLFKYPEFARQLLSTYYPFQKAEAKKYLSKVCAGSCFTHENGYHDVLTYYPGIIFNSRYQYFGKMKRQEFTLPITKSFILEWNKTNTQNRIIEAYEPYPDEYHLINKVILQSEKDLEKIYQEKLAHMYSPDDLEKIIHSHTDIIQEPEMWQLNFEPFISKKTVGLLFESMPSINELPAVDDFF